jgi:antitoxin CcdA
MDQSKGEARFPAATSDKEDRKVTWADENSLALEERRVWIEANGLPLRDLQVLKLD